MIIAIAAQKGGVAKTTTAIQLAAYFAKHEAKVLLIDIDAQGNSSDVLLSNYKEIPPEQTVAAILLEDVALVGHKTYIPNLFVCPSHIDLSEAEHLLAKLPAKERRLEMSLEKVKDVYDMIIVDSPPNLNDLPYNSIVASDYIITPFKADKFNLTGIELLNKKVKEINKLFNPRVKILGYLPTEYDQTTKISKTVYKTMVNQFGLFNKGGKVFETKIPKNVDITKASTAGLSIFDFNSKSKASEAYTTFIEAELIPYLLKNKNGK